MNENIHKVKMTISLEVEVRGEYKKGSVGPEDPEFKVLGISHNDVDISKALADSKLDLFPVESECIIKIESKIFDQSEMD